MQATRTYIVDYLKHVHSGSSADMDNLADDTSLLESGLLDSFGFLELILHLEETTGVTMDFSTVPPDQLTTLGALIGYIESGRRL
jgi:acyl carrier protein